MKHYFEQTIPKYLNIQVSTLNYGRYFLALVRPMVSNQWFWFGPYL